MLLIVGTIRMSSSRVLDAKPAMEAMIMASRAEPGCIDYSYAEDVLDRGLIHVKEAWENRAALDGHFASSHIAVWRASWQSLGITLCANDDETKTCREFTLEVIGQTSSVYAPNQRQEDPCSSRR